MFPTTYQHEEKLVFSPVAKYDDVNNWLCFSELAEVHTAAQSMRSS